MSVYNLIIEETVSKSLFIEAESAEEAIRIARKRYRQGETVLEPGDIEECRIGLAECPDNKWERVV